MEHSVFRAKKQVLIHKRESKMNQSKVADPRSWVPWCASGAVWVTWDRIIPIEKLLKTLRQPDFDLPSKQMWMKLTGRRYSEEECLAIYLLKIIKGPQGDKAERVAKLIREATQVNCSDERMREIVGQLESSKDVALDMIECFNSEYVAISWVTKRPPLTIMRIADAQQVQTFRLRSMLKGEEPGRRYRWAF